MQQSLVHLIRQNSFYDDDKCSEKKIHLDDEKSKENISILQGSKRCRKLIVKFSPAFVLLGTPENEMQVIKNYHLRYKFVKTECKLVRSILLAHGFKESHPKNSHFNLMWTGSHPKPFTLHALTKYQKVNHFPRSNELTRKDKLCKNIQRMQHSKGYRHFNFIPQSFILPTELNEFYNAFSKDHGPWIVKPCASSRGRGIFLINNSNDIPLGDNVMVCKYISNPLLINGFKFDCRLYVAVTSYDPLRIYLFEDGLTRFSTVKYDKSERYLHNQMMHLTNYSINKTSRKFVRCEDPEIEDYGSKWSFSGMLRFLKRQDVDTKALMARIEDLVIKTIISTEMVIATACKMFVPYRGNCFELFGFDVLIDESLKPWLLEVNLSPSLACESPLDLKIKANLITDLFNLAGFIAVDTTFKNSLQSENQNNELRSTDFAAAELKSLTNKALNKINDGLKIDERQLLHEANEEYKRRGGFIRIYPSPESWELYGYLHEHQTPYNRIIHSQLFPELWHFSQRPHSASYIAHTSILFPRNLSAQANTHLTSSNKFSARSQKHSFHYRYLQYERKLASWCSFKSINCGVVDAPTPKPSLAQGELNVETSCEAPIKGCGSLTISEVIKHGNCLRLLQARKAFAVYLEKVYHRLQQENELAAEKEVELKKQEKQIDSIERFLQKAAANLNNPIIHPFNHNPEDTNLIERKRNLINKLKIFVQAYLKESELFNESEDLLNGDNQLISKEVFETFLKGSSECDLEILLMNYTRRNKSTGLFFGVSSEKKEINTPNKNEELVSNGSDNTKMMTNGGQMIPCSTNLKINDSNNVSQNNSSLKNVDGEICKLRFNQCADQNISETHHKRLSSANALHRNLLKNTSSFEKQRIRNAICVYTGTNAMVKVHDYRDTTMSRSQPNFRNLYTSQVKRIHSFKNMTDFSNNECQEENSLPHSELKCEGDFTYDGFNNVVEKREILDKLRSKNHLERENKHTATKDCFHLQCSASVLPDTSVDNTVWFNEPKPPDRKKSENKTKFSRKMRIYGRREISFKSV